MGLLLLVVPKLADDVARTRRLRMEALEARAGVADRVADRDPAEVSAALRAAPPRSCASRITAG